MLAGTPPYEESLGLVERVDFQTRPDGWLLDDILVTTAAASTRRRTPSRSRATPSSLERLHPATSFGRSGSSGSACDSQVFEPTTDVLMLLTTPQPSSIRDGLNSLVSKAAANDPALLPARIRTAGWTNNVERDLFLSFACPPDLATAHGVSDDETAKILKCLRFVQRDYGIAASNPRGPRSTCVGMHFETARGH